MVHVRESHMLEAMVRGFYSYKRMCCAVVREELSLVREVVNNTDTHTDM